MSVARSNEEMLEYLCAQEDASNTGFTTTGGIVIEPRVLYLASEIPFLPRDTRDDMRCVFAHTEYRRRSGGTDPERLYFLFTTPRGELDCLYVMPDDVTVLYRKPAFPHGLPSLVSRRRITL